MLKFQVSLNVKGKMQRRYRLIFYNFKEGISLKA
jgi:hypothetical protein